MNAPVKRCLLVACALAAGLSGADRFSSQAEGTIPVVVGDREVPARIWLGRTTAVTSKRYPNRVLDVVAIYLSSQELLSWTSGPGDDSLTVAQHLEDFKTVFRCAAIRGEIACVFASWRWIMGFRAGETVEVTDIAALLGKRLIEINPDSGRRTNRWVGLTVPLKGVVALEPLFHNPHDMDSSVPMYSITRFLGVGDGLEMDIRNMKDGSIGRLRLDNQMRPISGAMVK